MERNKDLAARWDSAQARHNDLLRRLDEIRAASGLLQERLAAEAKEREYNDARARVERLEGDQAARANEINAAIDAGVSAAQGLSSSLASARRAARGLTEARSDSFRSSSSGPMRAVEALGADAALGARAGDRRPTAVERLTLMLTPQADDGRPPDLGDRLRAGMIRKALPRFVDQPLPPPGADKPQPFDSTRLVFTRPPAADGAPASAGGGPAEAAPVLDVPVNPGDYVTPIQYRDAVRERDRLDALIPRLQDNLKRLEAIRSDLRQYETEVEALRRQVCRNALCDILSATRPADFMAAAAKNTGNLGKLLTAENLTDLKTAEALMKAVLYAQDAREAEERWKREGKVFDGAANVLKGVAAQLEGDPEYPPIKALLLAYQALAKLHAADEQVGEAKPGFWEKLRIDADAATDVAALGFPELGVAKGFGNLAGDAYVLKWHVRPAQDDLAAALAANYDGERHLTDQLQRWQDFREEQQRLIRQYEASQRHVNGLRRGGGR